MQNPLAHPRRACMRARLSVGARPFADARRAQATELFVNPFELGGVSPLVWRELQARGVPCRTRLRRACAGCGGHASHACYLSM